jgi:hypothetical protein
MTDESRENLPDDGMSEPGLAADRRAALKRLGRFAVATAPAVTFAAGGGNKTRPGGTLQSLQF